MANNVNIFDKYGIKEVANVYFEALEDDIPAGVYKGDIVLFLDTLKVSTIRPLQRIPLRKAVGAILNQYSGTMVRKLILPQKMPLCLQNPYVSCSVARLRLLKQTSL